MSSSPIVWSQPFKLTSPAGTLDLSGDTDFRFLPDQCKAGVDLNVVKRPNSQGHGEIFPRRTKSGYVMRVAMELDDGGAVAMDTTLVSMWDELLAHLDALENPSLADLVSNCRIQWTPPGGDPDGSDDWMLNRIRCLERPDPSGVLPKIVTFAVDTELSYTMAAAETTTSLPDGVETTIDNSASTTSVFLPVFKVHGPTSGFTIVNADALDEFGNPKQFVYDAGLPGGAAIASGHYAEIACALNTITLDGSVSFLFEGLDVLASDFDIPLVRGTNRITCTGADADMLWNLAGS